jgi:hypothetical protein
MPSFRPGLETGDFVSKLETLSQSWRLQRKAGDLASLNLISKISFKQIMFSFWNAINFVFGTNEWMPFLHKDLAKNN